MANSFLDKTGLTYLWGKITALVSTKQDTLTFDNSPTQNSSNPVKSGGVYSALAGKAASDHTQAVNKGGTNITSYTTGDILYASGSTTLSKLNGNTTTTKKFLKSVATTSGTATAPAWDTLAAGDIPDLSWSKITSGKPTTLSGYGITDAAASGHTQAVNKGGTNITSYTKGDILYASAATTLSKLAIGTAGKFLKATADGPAWDSLPTASSSTAGIAKLGASGGAATYDHTHSTYVSKSGDTVNGVLIANNFVSKYGVEFQNSSGTNVGGIFQDMEGANQFYMDEYTTSGVRECYLLPTPDATSTSFYDILTSKSAVTVAQGGTGATTAAGARTNLGLGSMATASTSDYVAKAGDTMTGNLVFNNGNYKGINIKGGSGAPSINFYNTGTRLTIDEYASGSTGGERYLLPIPSTLSSDAWYDILTSKSAVTVAQGGTGATTEAGARTNLGLGSMATASTADYVAKAGDTMTGVLRAPCYFSTDNGSTGYNGLSFTSGTNVVKARVHYKQEANVSSHLVFGQDSIDGTKYASFHLPEITANEDYNIITTANAIISGFKTTQAGGYEIDQWGNFKHTSDTANNSFCIDSNAGAHNFKYTFETGALELAGDLTVAGYINGASGVYATNGALVSRAATPQLLFQNASAQNIGGMYASSNHVYIRERPSAGSGYVTDIVFPAAKSNGNENVYVYTSRNFSLSGTTLTITVPS